MVTEAAGRSLPDARNKVWTRAELAAIGIGRDRIRAQCDAQRWQLRGSAVVLHNAALTRRQGWRVARINCGPRAVLTAFTAAEAYGLRSWERHVVHVLVPRGTHAPQLDGIGVRLHQRASWSELPGTVQQLPGALLVAASTFASPRPACGILAAAVQQGLTSAAVLLVALNAAPKLRHRAVLRAALDDIDQGSQALSEIDFYKLCRRFSLPLPQRQTLRRESTGRRRYVDATWRRSDGRLVVAEVDGALHLAVSRWWEDQLRQNELSLADAVVLRFPSVVVRTEPAMVAAQLRRALHLR